MPSNQKRELSFPEDSSPGERRLEELVSEYADRLVAGEKLEAEDILAEHPTLGSEILESLEAFLQYRSDRSAPSAPLGSLGDYTLSREIGRGGMGIVYDAWENSMDRRVALKVLPTGAAVDDKTFHRFMREARTAGKLSHPNVVPVYGVGLKDRTPYYAMEFVEGETLAQVLARLKAAEGEDEERTILRSVSRMFRRDNVVDGVETSLSEEEIETAPRKTPFGTDDSNLAYYYLIAEAFAGVAEGLQHAHSKGVIHRDIKPSNLILESEGADGGSRKLNGRIRILDFGLARLEGQESLTLSGDLMGTVLYMSPEQAMAKRIPLDHRTDIYSLGTTLYEMLTWEVPFHGKDHQDTLSRIILHEPRPLRQLNPRIPKDLETIVLKCLRKDPKDRYGTAEALAQDLGRFARGDPIEARAQSPWERVTRRLWRYRRVAVIALLVAIVLVTTSALLFNQYLAKQRGMVADYEARVLSAVMKLQLGGVSVDPEGGGPLRVSVGGRLYGFGDFQRLLEKARVDPVSEAIEALEETAKILPERPDAYFHAARGLLALERREEARAQLDRALRLAPGFAPAKILRDVLEESDEEERLPTDSVREIEGADWQRVWLSAYRAMKEGRWTDASGHYGELIRPGETRGHEPYLGSTIESRLGRGLARLEAKDFRAVEDFAWVQFLWPDALEPVLLRAKAYYLVNEELAEEEFQRVYDRADESRKGEVALWVTALYQSVWEYDRCEDWVERVKIDSVRASMKAVILFNLRRWREALAAAEEAVELDPQDPATYRARAIVQARRVRDPGRDLDGAMKSLREALSVDENDYLSAYWMADVLMDTGNFEDAEKWLLRARDLNRSFGPTYVYLGRCAFEAGHYQEAFDLYEQAREHGAHGPAGLNIRGTWFHALGRLDDALRDYEEATRLAPNLIGPHLNRGKLLWARGHYDAAADVFRAATTGYPRTPDSHGYLGSLLEERGQLKEAFSEYRKAFELEPSLRDALKALCSLLRDRETAASLGEELVAFVKALRAVEEPDREHRYVLTLKALAYIRQYPGRQDVDDAYAWVKQAVETMGERRDPYILVTLAELQFLEGNAAQAIVTLEEAVGRPEARPAHAELLAEYRRVSGALPSYRSTDAAMGAIDRSSIDADALRARLHAVPGGEEAAHLGTYLEAWLLQLAAEHDRAAREFARLVEPGSARWEPLSRLVESLRRSGQSEQAERLLREIIEKSPKAHRDIWDLWLCVSFVDLGQSPGEILDRLPVETRVGSETPAPGSKTRPSYRDNVRWLLEQLSSTGVVRINCGGNEIEAPGGITWGRDRFSSSGQRRRCFMREVKGPPVCESERRFADDLHAPAAYRIPLPPGRYQLTLWFAESWYDAPGMRLFDVRVEGETLLTGYDVYASVGLATADRKQFDVRVEDGQLDVEFELTKSEVWLSGLEVRLLE